MEEFGYRLLKYMYFTYSQGTRDRAVDYALIRCPRNASFANVRSTLFLEKHVEGIYEIDIESVEDMTLKW